MATIAAIQGKLSGAVRQLVEADRSNPNTLLSARDIRANPYARPKGDNGAVDKNEARGVADSLARSMFDAATHVHGQNIAEGGSGGFRETVLPAWEVSYGDLRLVQSHVNAVVAKLETDASGQVTRAALDALPQTLADHFKAEFGNTRPVPRQVTLDRLAVLIREAATGVVDWR